MAPLVDHVFPLLHRETAAEEAGEALNRRLTIGVVVTCLMLSIISFSLRIYGRMYSRAKLWLDDYWMMGVMVLCFAMSACDFVGTGLPFSPSLRIRDKNAFELAN